MSKVLIVLPSVQPRPITRLLRLLGIPFEVAYLTGDLQTPAGTIAWNNDAAIRNYLRGYRAVLVGLEFYALSSSSLRMRAFRWLGWNDPQDPPVAYIGVYPRAGNPDFTVPSDFPILPPDPANPAGTTASYAATNFGYTAHLRVHLVREGVELYISAANLYQDNSGTGRMYLLDTAKHLALGDQGEILAKPVSEDVSFPSNAILAYRYRNRYLFPMTTYAAAPATDNFAGLFWVLYALKCMGVPPAYSLPLFLVMDDALTLHAPPAGSENLQPTFAQWTRIGYETYRHLAEVLHPRSGMAMVCGIFTGGRYGRRSLNVPHENTHWDLVVAGRRWTGSTWQTLDSETQANLQAWHQLLVQHHPSALPCTPHDHSLYHHANRTHTSFRRHSDAGFAYAAPNDVPLTRGGTLVRHANYAGTPPPNAHKRTIQGETYWEWGFSATSGTGEVIGSLTPNNYHAARLLWETAVAEMQALGFPDGIGGGRYPLIISPGGYTGDVPVWQAQYDLGFRLTRCNLRSVHTPPDTNPASLLLAREGMHFALGLDVDMSVQYDAQFGLYHPDYASRTAVGKWNLDIGGDITGLWNSDRAVAAQRAYRRAIGMATHTLLRAVLCYGVMMAHPYNLMTWADPNDPTRPFDPNDPNSRINFLLEIAWNMEKVVAVLSPYLKWGDVLEYLAARERVVDV
ncbi:MAG: hypothetical protein RMK45_01910 [Armatimonadota bacterium]|nr:hypothetical protein [Armatimonadota bacterium]